MDTPSECIVCTPNLSVSNRRWVVSSSSQFRRARGRLYVSLLSCLVIYISTSYFCLGAQRLGEGRKDVKKMLTHKIKTPSVHFQREGRVKRIQLERINKHKITDNEVSSRKYLIVKFMYLCKHI